MITEAMMVVDEEAAQYAGQACAHAKKSPHYYPQGHSMRP